MANQSGVFKDKSNEFGGLPGEKTGEFGKDFRHMEKGSNPDPVSNLISGAEEKVGEFATNIGTKTRNIASKAKDAVNDTYENVGSMMKEYPTQSFFIGLGLGCLVGATVTAILKR